MAAPVVAFFSLTVVPETLVTASLKVAVTMLTRLTAVALTAGVLADTVGAGPVAVRARTSGRGGGLSAVALHARRFSGDAIGQITPSLSRRLPEVLEIRAGRSHGAGREAPGRGGQGVVRRVPDGRGAAGQGRGELRAGRERRARVQRH